MSRLERPPAGLSPLLEVRGLRKAFGERPVLDGVSFTIEAGTIVALAGSNGAGKSTLLRCLAGLARYRGAVVLRGAPLGADPTARRAFGYLPQDVGLPDRATVGEVLALFARLRHAPVDVGSLASGFLPDPDARVGTLSGGQRQRLLLAVALLGRPALLLLDEPVASLDESGRRAVWEALGRYRDEGGAALVASPSPADLAGTADRVLVLVDGRVARDGPLEATRFAAVAEAPA